MIVASFYGRKSNDEQDKSAEAKSVEVQRALATKFAAERGWTLDPRFVFVDDGISGATFDRPGLQALLAALKTKVFTRVIVAEQSRLGRDTVGVVTVLQQIEKAGAQVWSTRDNRQITLEDDFGEIVTLLGAWRDKSERKKTIARVKDSAAKRFESGYVVSSVPFGYSKTAREEGSKANRRLVVNEAQANTVRRVFDEYARGLGFKKIARLLQGEGVPAPTKKGWSVSAVREMLQREAYNGIRVYGTVIRTGPDKSKDRKRVPRSEWKRTPDENLRIVTPEQWRLVQDRLANSAKSYLRRADGKVISQAERTRGQHLLSGFLVCGALNASRPNGICGAPLTVSKFGKAGRMGYACRDHREGRDCQNKTAVPYAEAHQAIIAALRRTFSPEAFEAHLANIANDAEAKERRDTERANLLVEIPKFAAQERKLAQVVAVSDDVDALVEQIKALQAQRKAAEARVTELEAIDVDVRQSREQVERLKATWSTWEQFLAAHDVKALPEGTYGAAQARQVLRKVLVGPIVVTPVQKPSRPIDCTSCTPA